MVRVVNGNFELRVADDEVAAYLEKGYAVVGSDGKQIKVKKAYTYDELVTICQKQERTIRRHDVYVAETEAKIADLEAEIKRLNQIIDAEPSKTSVETIKAETEATGGAEKKTAQSAKKS